MQMKYGVGSENRHNLDSRKRVFIPARIRDLLGKDLVISRDVSHDRPCLCIYSAEGWDARLERILADCESEAERQDMLDVLCYCMIPAELDEQGRVTLTKQLISHADIEKEVVITGSGDHALMWSAAIYDEMRSDGNDFESLKAILGRKRTKPSGV
jgi:MraZ protein